MRWRSQQFRWRSVVLRKWFPATGGGTQSSNMAVWFEVTVLVRWKFGRSRKRRPRPGRGRLFFDRARQSGCLEPIPLHGCRENALWCRKRLRVADSLPFYQRVNIIGREISQLFQYSAGPLDFYGIQL